MKNDYDWSDQTLTDLAVRMCELVRVKKPSTPGSHNVPQLAVVVDESAKTIHLLAGNLDRLKKKGNVLARTLHQRSWKQRHGADPAYRDCIEVSDVEPSPKKEEWDSVVTELRARGYHIEASTGFRCEVPDGAVGTVPRAYPGRDDIRRVLLAQRADTEIRLSVDEVIQALEPAGGSPWPPDWREHVRQHLPLWIEELRSGEGREDG